MSVIVAPLALFLQSNISCRQSRSLALTRFGPPARPGQT
jgi:hypothetical protein